MKFKILTFEGCPTCNEVLLQVCILNNDFENVVVEITAWHKQDDEERYQHESIDFPNMEMAERFVADYSQESAVLFVCDYPF